ncbi:hypothetical protein LAZ67_6003178 [Cordylochernes scorpioides]|uniref:Endonuclease/exonuclease/phosphatase domain-containing protein n=1 Tax=Cordylochernes scorpioides TaxID=51811 RepID=A0ABY6KQA8_9ARAC|nr:hypothetical protein LAZ67_6003178 [Cordylochernes scorpioides]
MKRTSKPGSTTIKHQTGGFLAERHQQTSRTLGEGRFHRRAKAKTSFQDDDVPIDDETTTKPLFTPQENGRKGTMDKVPRIRWNPWQKHVKSMSNIRLPVFININLPENPCSEFLTHLKLANFQLVKSLNFVWVHTIETLSEPSLDITIILGEFNDKSSIWGSPVQDNKSQQVEDMLTDLDLTPLNNGENTYLSKSTGTESAIDITAINYNIAPTTQWKILRELCTEKLNYRTLDKNLEKFSSNISKAAKASIPRGKRKYLWLPFWKDHNIEAMIAERDNINELLKTNKTEENRKKLIEISHKIEQEIWICKQEKWQNSAKNGSRKGQPTLKYD